MPDPARRVRPARLPRLATLGLCLPVAVGLSACSSGANPADLRATASTFTAGWATPTTAVPNPSAVTSPKPSSVTSSDKVFNFVVPSGWNLSNKPKAITYLSSATQAHDVVPTIVVTKSGVQPAPALDETSELAMRQARQGGLTVDKLPDRTLGGERAVSFSTTGEEKNVKLLRTYVIVAHEKKLYTVALTAARADAATPARALDDLVASWTWTKSGDPRSTANGTTPASLPMTTSGSPSPSSSGTSSPGGSTANGSAEPGASASSTASATPSPSPTK